MTADLGSDQKNTLFYTQYSTRVVFFFRKISLEKISNIFVKKKCGHLSYSEDPKVRKCAKCRSTEIEYLKKLRSQIINSCTISCVTSVTLFQNISQPHSLRLVINLSEFGTVLSVKYLPRSPVISSMIFKCSQ